MKMNPGQCPEVRFSISGPDRWRNDGTETPQKAAHKTALEKSEPFLPGEAHLPRAWCVRKKRRHDDPTAWFLCSLTQETPLNTGPEQPTATTRRRLAMMHTHPTHTPRGARRDRQHLLVREQRGGREGGRAVITHRIL